MTTALDHLSALDEAFDTLNHRFALSVSEEELHSLIDVVEEDGFRDADEIVERVTAMIRGTKTGEAA